ncbi:MAG: hypothetical protein A2Y38_25290 [Spirochaetes bacterium GWB1_59_5]|nr:MAG: hypothetical protein A2Y38_25290 [Spirochaetes bacterium GWB1_59_5]
MSKRQARKHYEATGEVPEGFFKLDSGEIIPRSRLCSSLRTGNEDFTLKARQNGTAYRVTESGAHVRLGEKKLNKAERKMLKKIKRLARDSRDAVMEGLETIVGDDKGRPVPPHRSGGAQPPLQLQDVTAVVDGVPLGPCTVTVFPHATDKPAPVRCLTPEAREARADFERRYASGGGCSCHISPPCGYCTDPDNPANQDEDDSCWMEKVPDVVAEDPARFMLSGFPSPFGGFVLTACVDCDHSDRCVNDEAVLRSYDRCGDTRPPAMNVHQREWCLQEINEVEGWNRDDYEAVPDQELARAVVQAWGDYARDKGVV